MLYPSYLVKDCSLKLFSGYKEYGCLLYLPLEEEWVPKSEFRVCLFFFDICLFLNGDGVVMEMAFYSKLLLLANVSFIDFV